MSNLTKTELQQLFTKIIAFLEDSTKTLHILEVVVTEQNFLIITFVFGKSAFEEVVFCPPAEWTKLEFFDLAKVLIDKIDNALPMPRSSMSH